MNSDRKQRIYKTIMLVMIVAVTTFIATTVFLYNKLGIEDKKYIMVTGNQDNNELTTKINSFKKLIDKVYLGEIKEEELNEGAIKGYVKGLGDPYSEYYTKEEMEQVAQTTLGNFSGIGIYMIRDTEKNQIVILSPIEGTPAEKAGILSGDIIKKVDGVEYTGEQMTLASSKIKGKEGTNVKLEILREGETKTFEITREKIKINHVTSQMKENGIGYLKLSTFDEGCAEEFKQKFLELKEEDIKSLIIDLRNNGGGIVDEALKIADMIVEKDLTTLITIDKNNNEEVKKSKSDPIINVPIILLVNEDTASASEILAGILKDYKKAKIIGTKTYGKGVIQELMTLKDGSGIKITTNEYLTPNKNKINGIGIIPDEEVNLPEDLKKQIQIEEAQDTQLKKAIDLLK